MEHIKQIPETWAPDKDAIEAADKEVTEETRVQDEAWR